MNERPANKRAVVAALTVCVATMGFIAYRIIVLIERREGGRHGLVLALPLFCVACGLMAGMTWMESNGKTAGPWRLIIALTLFLATLLVSVVF